MARPRPEQKRGEKKLKPTQPDLPAMQPPEPGTTRVFPSQLRIGDQLSDTRGEWEVASRPHSTSGGKTVSVRVWKPGGSATFEERAWNAYDRITIKRANAAEGKR